MTDEEEEQRNDTIDRLGGKSRLAKLEELVATLRVDVDVLKAKSLSTAPTPLLPGVTVDMTAVTHNFVSSSGVQVSPGGDAVVLAVGIDYVVVQDQYDEILLSTSPGVQDALKWAVK